MKNLKRVFWVFVLSFFAWAGIGNAGEILIGYTGPLSGPAAEYGRDCANGVEMAVQDINAAGGVKIKGEKYLFKLEKMDDRVDPTLALNNARRIRAKGAIAVFNPVFTCIAALKKINEEKDAAFILMGYTSTPMATEIANTLHISIPPPFTVYNSAFLDMAWKQGWRKAAMLITLGAYGDENRVDFRQYWEKLGGTITTDKPANYYTETDFSSQLTAVLSTKPDVIFAGGPSATTALVVEQARNMGFTGGFVFIDQARADYCASILKEKKLLDKTISVAAVDSIPFAGAIAFNKRYMNTYKRINNMEAVQNYMAMQALAKAIEAAGKVDDVVAIRAAFPKAFPLIGNQFPTEAHGITEDGRMMIFPYAQMVKEGKPTVPEVYAWWPKTEKEFQEVKKVTKSTSPLIWKTR